MTPVRLPIADDSATTDGELVLAARAGSPFARERLFWRYGRKVNGMVFHKTASSL